MVQRILTQRSWNTDLAQVVQQDPDTVVQQDPDTVVQKDPDTEILHKWSYRILTQAVQRTLIQRSCTSGPTGSWYKWSKRILIQRSWARSCTNANKWCKRILMRRSCYKCRANSPSLLVGVRSHTLFGVSCRDNLFFKGNRENSRYLHLSAAEAKGQRDPEAIEDIKKRPGVRRVQPSWVWTNTCRSWCFCLGNIPGKSWE